MPARARAVGERTAFTSAASASTAGTVTRGGDIFDLVQWLHGVSFSEACQLLATDPSSFSERQLIGAQPVEEAGETTVPGWQSEVYQTSARRTIAATHRLLLSREGTPGQTYLRQRSLLPATWNTYRLGFGRTFHPLRRQNQAAIFIPWLTQDQAAIMAIRHRFTATDLAKHERYALKPGSEPLLFGLHALQPAPTLIVVEGEFNCMALHQSGVQAVSLGSESNRYNDAALAQLRDLLPRYERVLVWLDNLDYAQAVREQLAETAPFRKEKIRAVAHELDANDFLVRGELADVLKRL